MPIATHVPHAAGLAWGEKLKGNSTVAITYFGDGATSEGAFHEGANLAAVMQAPLILFCNNNQWAISTPLEAQTHAETLADKAVGYGMPGVRVDGGDVLAVFEATREAVERAREGGGPTFIEAVTYRAAPHATADDPRAYIDLDRVEEEKRNECVGRYERYLRRLGVLDDATAEEIKNEALEAMRQGIAEAEAEPEPDPELVFDNAYVEPPACRTDPRGLGCAELFMVEAINDGFHVELARDDDVMVMGEDVGRAGGVFRATAGLRDRFGENRCVDTPLAEAGILGSAIGLCMAGWRPVCEMQYDAFSYPCLDQLINHVGRYRWRTRRRDGVPARRAHAVRRRRPRARAARRLAGGVLRAHARREGRDPVDAGRREGAARGGDPRPRSGRRARAEARLPHARSEVPEGEHVVPLGKARLAREGDDVTLVAYGAMVPVCERAADALEGEASVEVLDLRTLKPLDEEALLASASKTGRVVDRAGGAAHRRLRRRDRGDPRREGDPRPHGPVLRVTGYDVPYPYWKIEDAYMPSVERVVGAARQAPRILSLVSGSGSSAASRATGCATPRPGTR